MTLPRLPYNFAKRHRVLLTETQGEPEILFLASTSIAAITEAQRVASQAVSMRLVDKAEFDTAVTGHYQNNGNSAESLALDMDEELSFDSLEDVVPQAEDLMAQEDEAPIIRLINAMLTEATKKDASDIHIDSFENHMLIRFRVDGVLQEVLQPNRALAPLLISRIKVMAKLDIAEKRIPQDGRISLKVAGREVDVRVSTLPANNSERIVLRLLDKQLGKLEFSSLGMDEPLQHRFQNLLSRPHGIILVTGPTGSGKTTSLYAGLQSIQTGRSNILTIEDPVEYHLEGIGQTQVNVKTGMTFAKGLRAVLRQDPDVVMVGEIRDFETAQIAIQASLTGHLVLSTLHTNTAVGAITRLEDMGVEPFLLASSMIGVMSQRLVRTLCHHCKTPHHATPKEQEILAAGMPSADIGTDNSPLTIYRPSGCDHCNHQGYKGRRGIYELIEMTDTMRELVHDKASEAALTNAARTHSDSLFADGVKQILAGNTSLEEVLRVTRDL